ncbi:hypothetical protein CK203_026375 [Vitis vinifera]|uniref:Uncharacterized protein n=1 Tax=Vitis vinifera TaxID=29760 RepID=A0A438IVN6_VITVI|nr:hypothetical protein CK203_026375 [Vitis vinifera]
MADYQQRAAAHYNRKARPRTLKVGEKAVKVTKRKALIGKACGATFFLARGNRRDVPFDTMLLHAATVAKEIHLVYLLCWAISSSASCRRASVDSSRLFASASSIRRASLSSGTSSKLQHSLQRLSGQRISWLRPLQSQAQFLFTLCAGRRRPSYNRQSAAGLKKDRVVEPCPNTAHQLQKNPQQEVQLQPCDKHISMARKIKK